MPNKDDQAKQSQEEPQEDNDSQNEQGETGAEGNNGQDPKEPEGNGTGQDGNVEDKHGQPGINREKYQRDIQERDDRIKELEEQVAEAIKTEEGRKELQEKIDELRQTIADDRVNFDLERAGCLNTKAARALLDDYEGDVDQLKEACPYLFQEEKRQTGSTGAKPQGAPDTKVDDTLDRIFGTEKKG